MSPNRDDRKTLQHSLVRVVNDDGGSGVRSGGWGFCAYAGGCAYLLQSF